MIVIAFSLFLSGCQQTLIEKTDAFSERQEIAFTEWAIPGYFIPKQYPCDWFRGFTDTRGRG